MIQEPENLNVSPYVQESAKILLFSHGEKAPGIAMSVAEEFSQKGNPEGALVWRQIMAICRRMLETRH